MESMELQQQIKLLQEKNAELEELLNQSYEKDLQELADLLDIDTLPIKVRIAYMAEQMKLYNLSKHIILNVILTYHRLK